MSAQVSSTTLTFFLIVHDGAAAIEFYQNAFGAQELYRLTDPVTGKVGHAELMINGVLVMLAGEFEGLNRSPKSLGGTSVNLSCMSNDAKADYDRALAAGAEVVRPLDQQFYGHLAGRVRDPFGREWLMAQEIERLSPAEMQRRCDAMVPKRD